MDTIASILSDWLKKGFERALPPEQQSVAPRICAVPAASAEFGDYQCNAAMPLARAAKENPRILAQKALDAAGAHAAVRKAEIAGPGFINLVLDDAWLAGYVAALDRDARFGVPATGAGKTVIIDYASPNVAKPMHVGHIRSTVIGNALDRIYRFLGHRVISDNHIGDWGTQFGVLIMGYKNFVDETALHASPIDELERIYVKSYERLRGSEEWRDACRNELVKLQSGDDENMRLWRKFVDMSMAEFSRLFDRLGVSFDLCRGESFYHGMLAPLVRELEDKGLARESEGALVVFLDDEKLPPCIVRKSDGAFNYAATDLACAKTRVEEFRPDMIVYVTDERQQTHFRQIFAICRRLGLETRFEHVWFGLMRLPEGTFSTRDGNVIKLEKLLDEAESRALKLADSTESDMPERRRSETAAAVGIGAVKYADLSQNPQSLVVFSWDKAMALNGNSGPYLQYAYARIRSVQDKFSERFPGVDCGVFPVLLGEPSERALALKLAHFSETVIYAAESFKPSVLADYLYDLAAAYSNYYQNVPFLKAPDGTRESRMRLCGAVGKVLRAGLELLGMETPDRI